MTVKTIYIFRHGQTDYNANRRVMGQLDVPLNDVGLNQAAELATKLSGESIQAIYSSPLSRSMQTAQIVSEKLGAPVYQNLNLVERHNGFLQGHIVHASDDPTDYQTDRRYRKLCLPINNLNDDDWRPDGGETRRECWARAQRAVMDIIKNSPHDTIAISTHGGVMNGILNMVGMSDLKIGNCDYVKLTFNGTNLQK